MRVLIIHNVTSGFGSDAIFEFERLLLHEGDECVMRVLRKDAPDLGASLIVDAESFDLVVVSGGDGTVATLLYLLRGRNVLICVFPSGTANLFFANLGNAPDPSALARACRFGRATPCDLGEIMWFDEWGVRRRQGFSIMAGIGFDAQIMQAAIPAKRAMGQAAYFAAAVGNLRPAVRDFRITVDGVVHERRGIACLVANNAKIQGDIELVPDCTMDDGLLDVLVLAVDATPQLLQPIVFGLVDPEGKKIGRPHLETLRGTDILVEATDADQIEIDGDPMPGEVRAFRARALPASVRLIVDPLSRYYHESHQAPLFGDTEEIAFPY